MGKEWRYKLNSTIGAREEGFYKVSEDSTHALVHHTIDPCELCHRRFGHLHYKALPGLQKMVTGMPEVSPKHEGIYKGCALGNNTKKSFPKSKNRSKGILNLIHSDICGPMSSPSLSGCLYYVLFIDDHSRKSWIYFLEAKSETFDRSKSSRHWLKIRQADTSVSWDQITKVSMNLTSLMISIEKQESWKSWQYLTILNRMGLDKGRTERSVKLLKLWSLI